MEIQKGVPDEFVDRMDTIGDRVDEAVSNASTESELRVGKAMRQEFLTRLGDNPLEYFRSMNLQNKNDKNADR